MRLEGEAYSERLRSFSTYTLYLISMADSSEKQIAMKATDITTDSELSEKEVQSKLIELLNSVIGENNTLFENNTFDQKKWLAPTITSADVIENIFASMKLVGRTVQDVRIFGLSYWHTEESIEDSAYNALPKSLSGEERQRQSNFNNISDELQLVRHAIIDDPFMIKFTDGDIFEIDTPQEPEYSFSMNCIPWDIKSGHQRNNIDASILFEPFLGKQIVDVEISKEYTNKDPMLHCYYDEERTKREIVTRVVLWLENDIGISISGWIDYCDISCINRNNELVPITFGELKKALRN